MGFHRLEEFKAFTDSPKISQVSITIALRKKKTSCLWEFAKLRLTNLVTCLDLAIVLGMSALWKARTTWIKLIDIPAISVQFVTENFTSASNGIMSRDIKTSLLLVKNSEVNLLRNKNMRRERNHTKTGMKIDSKLLVNQSSHTQDYAIKLPTITKLKRLKGRVSENKIEIIIIYLTFS